MLLIINPVQPKGRQTQMKNMKYDYMTSRGSFECKKYQNLIFRISN